MNKQEFLELVRDPQKLSSLDLERLEDLVKAFPYCQAAHVLIAKITHQESSMLAIQKLKIAAAYILERKKLRKLLSINSNALKVAKGNKKLALIGEVFSKEEKAPIVPFLFENQDLAPIAVVAEKKPDSIVSDINDSSKINGNVKGDSPESEINHIATLKQEPVKSAHSDVNRPAFFEELERNLQNLKKLREQNRSAIQGLPQANLIPLIPSVPPVNESDSVEEVKKTEVKDEIEITSSSVQDNKPPYVEEFIIPDIKVIIPDIIKAKKQEVRSDKDEKPSFPTTREEDNFITAADKSDKMHYQVLMEYLDYLATKKKKKNVDKDKINHIIDKFITEEPTIPYFDIRKINEDPLPPMDLASKNLKSTTGIASENFAKILERQGKIAKAITIYQELILKNPEKKAYFANKIEELNKKI